MLKPQVKISPQAVGGVISAAKLNQIGEYLNKDSQRFPGTKKRFSWQVTNIQIGQVTTTGPGTPPQPDFTDYRYYVQLQLLAPDPAALPTDLIGITPNLNYGIDNLVVAINLGEFNSLAHSAYQNNDVVLLAQVRDSFTSATYPMDRYFILGGGGAGTLPQPEYQGQVLMAVAQLSVGYEFPIAHSLLTGI